MQSCWCSCWCWCSAPSIAAIYKSVAGGGGSTLQVARPVQPPPLTPAIPQVTALVDAELNRRARAHHTATHLLQSALKSVLGPDTCQQGSLVNFQRLR